MSVQVRSQRHRTGQQAACATELPTEDSLTGKGEVPVVQKACTAQNSPAGIGSPDHIAAQVSVLSQSAHAGEGIAAEVFEAGLHDCTTPHHSMLPAPGANMLSAGHQARVQLAGSAELGSTHEDPIVATAWYSKRQCGGDMQPRRKPGSKTWTTLNLQHASVGAQHIRKPASSHLGNTVSVSGPVPITDQEHGVAARPSHLPHQFHAHAHNSLPPQSGRPNGENPCNAAAEAEVVLGQAFTVSAQLPDRQNSGSRQTDRLVPENSSDLQMCALPAPAQQHDSNCTVPPVATVLLPHLPLDGSETQPELSLCHQAGEPSLGTQPGQAVGTTQPSNASHFCDACSCAPASPLETAGPSCESIPDSMGNRLVTSQGAMRCLHQHATVTPVNYATTDPAACDSKQVQGWQLVDGPVLALVSLGR